MNDKKIIHKFAKGVADLLESAPPHMCHRNKAERAAYEDLERTLRLYYLSSDFTGVDIDLELRMGDRVILADESVMAGKTGTIERFYENKRFATVKMHDDRIWDACTSQLKRIRA